MTPLVAIEHLSKSFPGVRALNNCRFELLAGEVHALMGENGAGKSTLMKVLAGVYQKDEGEIRVDGQLVDIPSPRAAQALGIGIIHQELNLMNHLQRGAEHLHRTRARGRLGVFIDRQKMDQDARKIFERLHLNLDPRTPVGDLTVAKQQMVEIAKALSFESRVLIMDEPTAALNNAEIDDLFRIIRQLKSHGVGIVYISHKMDELKKISDRVTVMRDGQYIDTVPTASTSMDTIISMMVGRTLFESDRRGCARHGPRSGAGGAQPEPRPGHQGRELRGAQGRDPGFRRADGRGPHGSGARRVRRGQGGLR